MSLQNIWIPAEATAAIWITNVGLESSLSFLKSYAIWASLPTKYQVLARRPPRRAQKYKSGENSEEQNQLGALTHARCRSLREQSDQSQAQKRDCEAGTAPQAARSQPRRSKSGSLANVRRNPSCLILRKQLDQNRTPPPRMTPLIGWFAVLVKRSTSSGI
jgi:hypothetical protein